MFVYLHTVVVRISILMLIVLLNSVNLLSIPSTADESVKYLTASNGILNESIILCASLTANSAPTSSILGIDILHLGATLVLPARRRHCTVPSAILHLKYANAQLAEEDPSPKIISVGLPLTAPSGFTDLGNEIALRSARCFTTSLNSLLVPAKILKVCSIFATRCKNLAMVTVSVNV